jgi:hypothetical protein
MPLHLNDYGDALAQSGCCNSGISGSAASFLIVLVLMLWVVGGYTLQLLALDPLRIAMRVALLCAVVVCIRAPSQRAASSSFRSRVYLLIAISMMSVALLSAFSLQDPMFSVSRAMACAVSLIIAYRAVDLLVDWSEQCRWKWTQMFNGLLFMFLALILVGGLLLPEWRSGIAGTRLNGGTIF